MIGHDIHRLFLVCIKKDILVMTTQQATSICVHLARWVFLLEQVTSRLGQTVFGKRYLVDGALLKNGQMLGKFCINIQIYELRTFDPNVTDTGRSIKGH